MNAENKLVKMVGIKKSFGTVQALKGIDFDVDYGEIVGLVGDNGAGKSTLIKILTGVFPPNEGDIFFEGRKETIDSPKKARDLGIETVYQNLALIELMSISRNFFLGREIFNRFANLIPILNMRRMNQITETSLKDMGIAIRSVEETVSTLSGGERQSVAIGRAVHFGAKLLILDEPTAALSVRESRRVLDHVIEAKEEGVSVIFITHNIYHVYSVADRLTVLERGVKVGDFKKETVTPEDIMEILRVEHAQLNMKDEGKPSL